MVGQLDDQWVVEKVDAMELQWVEHWVEQKEQKTAHLLDCNLVEWKVVEMVDHWETRWEVNLERLTAELLAELWEWQKVELLVARMVELLVSSMVVMWGTSMEK